MYKPDDLQKIINDKIKNINFKIEPVELYSPIEYILDGSGKRLRPLLTLMSCNLFSENIDKAVNPAIGLEVFHNFTLLHDDIMDKADMRRKKETVHKKWNENVAILSGDAMMIKAYEFFFSLEPELLSRVLPVFNKTALQVCEGQQYDMNFETRMDVSTDEYLHMITLKTAVLLAASLKIGAMIGGADEKNSEALYNFGINLGIAFQLQDDYLDVYGDFKTFGKKIGGDITSNKKTFMLLSVMEKATGATKTRFQELLNGNVEAELKIKEVTAIYNQLNIPEIVKSQLSFYQEKAIADLNRVKVNEEKKKLLKSISLSLLERNK
jgi:geranylgeranyl diphosphate synthase, type II